MHRTPLLLVTAGVTVLGVSALLADTPRFTPLLLLGLWLVLMGGVHFRLYGVAQSTPRLSIGQREQLTSNLSVLASAKK